MAAPVGRVCIALDAGPFVWDPIWTRIDDVYPNLVSGFDIRRGRQTERDQTDTGTATVFLNDTHGLFDPENTGSVFWDKLDGKQIVLQVFNPISNAWVQQFRGRIDEYGFDIHPSQVVSNVQIECVDLFDYLGRAEMAPGIDGDTPPSGSERVVYYEGTAVNASVDERVIQILTNAGLTSSWWVVFSGNVRVQATRYEPGDVFLQAIRDASDAEWPGIANCYVDKKGRIQWHGRFARFTPEDVEATTTPDKWDFNRWMIGDGIAISLEPERAQVRELAYSRSRQDIINAALCYPRGIKDKDMPGQVRRDATSISNFGLHSWSAPDLITLEGKTTGFDANHECRIFSDYYINNMSTPQNRIKSLAVRSLDPADARGSATWSLICGHDISDIANISVGYPSGVGISNTDFYIEGTEMEVRPLGADYDDVTLNLNVSPAAWYPSNYWA